MAEVVAFGESIGEQQPAAEHGGVNKEYNTVALDELHPSSGGAKFSQELFGNIPVDVTVMLGKTRVDLQKLLQLSKGDVIELAKKAGETVEIMVNSQLIAQGEIVAVGENYGVKVTKVISR
ncbi:MAG: flagellar motor switch protein FliN [Candidatus Margulisbacteria bacterium]|jgi:flagellar motor switch protein FliN/FliY|nr:flagellar motor switch protein FliN [Candidatus Margulisiibacteriota bacterium]